MKASNAGWFANLEEPPSCQSKAGEPAITCLQEAAISSDGEGGTFIRQDAETDGAVRRDTMMAHGYITQACRSYSS